MTNSPPPPTAMTATLPSDRGAVDPVVADLETSSLFAGRSELTIRHMGQFYRLRITRAGKLILTK